MKLKLTYTPQEREEGAAALAAILRIFPGAKVRRDKSRASPLAVYVTIDTTPPKRYNRVKE